MSASPYHRIGELLVAQGHLTPEQLEEALVWRFRTKQRFGEVLTELGFVLEEHVTGALAVQFDHPLYDLENWLPDPVALNLVDSEFAVAHVCLPVEIGSHGVKVAIADPLDIHTIDQLAAITKMRVDIVLAPPSAIKRAINRAYASKRSGTKSRPVKRQKDRDSLLELLSTVEPWAADASNTVLKVAA